MADVSDGRGRPDARPGASLPPVRAGEDRIRDQSLYERSEAAVQRDGKTPRAIRISGGRHVHDRRHRDVPVDAFVAEPGHRARRATERETLARGDRRTPGRAARRRGARVAAQGAAGRQGARDPVRGDAVREALNDAPRATLRHRRCRSVRSSAA
ncbi:hypothetical protein BVI2075_740040 [Burkholderia vietnamiensis]|nr:hypothetical protein BVI2075_740040 [Burkholderia vietnamiensis]